MVITDKSSKSFKDCMDYVYYKFRIAEPVVNSEGKLTKIFNGISVNSWFTPMGISVSPGKEHTPYSPVTKDLRTKLEERAKSASAVLGRRHFEIEQQEVGKDEILHGSAMFKSNSTFSVKRQHIQSASGRFCGNGSSLRSGEIRSKIASQRPHTCLGTRSDKTVYEPLTISAKSLVVSKIQQKSDNSNTDCATVRKGQVRLLSDFKTEHEMRDAFQMRVKSAPPSIQNFPAYSDPSETNKGTIPFYWKTKSIYHRKQKTNGVSCDNEDISESVSRGSLWKPLLYSTDGGVKHKAGCPYKCKGCFRACLVSQDYMDKMVNGKIQPVQNKKRSIKPKFYHRKIVEYAIANAQPIKEILEKEKQLKVLNPEENDSEHLPPD